MTRRPHVPRQWLWAGPPAFLPSLLHERHVLATSDSEERTRRLVALVVALARGSDAAPGTAAFVATVADSNQVLLAQARRTVTADTRLPGPLRTAALALLRDAAAGSVAPE